MDIKSEITKCELVIQHGQERLVELRKQCNHPSYKILLYSWRIGAYNPAKICDICHGKIGGPETEEEKATGEKLMQPFHLTGETFTIKWPNYENLTP